MKELLCCFCMPSDTEHIPLKYHVLLLKRIRNNRQMIKMYTIDYIRVRTTPILLSSKIFLSRPSMIKPSIFPDLQHPSDVLSNFHEHTQKKKNPFRKEIHKNNSPIRRKARKILRIKIKRTLLHQYLFQRVWYIRKL